MCKPKVSLKKSEACRWPEGTEVYHWPEFKALCLRLGVAWELPTKRVIIDVPIEGLVSITQEYHGRDTFEDSD